MESISYRHKNVCVGVNMIYINDNFASELLENSYKDLISLLEITVKLKKEKKVHQPLKPYLKFPEKYNRIIAMPAYVGGDIDICGIKWIASFPKNLEKNIRRANCVTVLNSVETGEPISIINSPELSIYRTASVSGMILKKYLSDNASKNVVIGIIGYGPIGQKHEDMCYKLFGDKIKKILLYDIKKIDKVSGEKSFICNAWRELYDEADVLITCTTASEPYLDCSPKKGKLTLNVSLRDFDIRFIDSAETVCLIDDWEEVNRENTNIENLSKENRLSKSDCIDIYDYLYEKIDVKDKALFFNPMGMAIFDVVVGKYMYDKAAIKTRGENYE